MRGQLFMSTGGQPKPPIYTQPTCYALAATLSSHLSPPATQAVAGRCLARRLAAPVTVHPCPLGTCDEPLQPHHFRRRGPMASISHHTVDPTPTLRTLMLRHQGAVVDLPTAAKECALAHQTLLNQLSRGTCRLPVFKQGRKWCVRVVDLAGYIDGQFLASNPQLAMDRHRRRGRPSKAEQVRRRIDETTRDAST